MTQHFKDKFYRMLKEETMKSMAMRGLKVQTSVSDGFFNLILLSIEEALDNTFKNLSSELKPIEKDNSE